MPTATHPPDQELNAQRAEYVRSQLPTAGLFAGQTWRTAPLPFLLDAPLAKQIEGLGRILHQFYKAANLLYRQSVAGKQPPWVAQWLDQGKPPELIEIQRAAVFKNDIPRVIRPDIILTDDGFIIAELDSVPGGIGLTAWLNHVYSSSEMQLAHSLVGGPDGMLAGFESIFGDAPSVQIIVSEEAKSYRPEMEWMVDRLTPGRFHVRDDSFTDFAPGDAVYRFFELFDRSNVRSAPRLTELALNGEITLTPPIKPLFEEKMLFALFWNRNLRDFWRTQLGESFFNQLQRHIPYTWFVDPTPLPPHAALPILNQTDWQQLKTLSQKDRALILKISGYSEQAWGSRGVHLGSDLSLAEWSSAVDEALESFPTNPYVLQQFHKPRSVDVPWHDFATSKVETMHGRVRLCPYYFLAGAFDQSRPQLGGILATITPADKKIVHGMTDAILAPCAA